MMWTWASETEWTRLEWPEKALYTDVTLKNCGNAMALRFSVYKTEVTSHLESGEALCIWVGQRTIARTSHPGEQEEDWKVILTQQAMITGLPKSVESRARRKGREGSAHNRMLHCFLKRNFSPSLCRSWPRSPHPLQRKVLRPGHGGHGGCSPSPWVWCSARPFVPPSHSLCYQHTRPSLSAGSRPRPSPLPSLTATAWEDEGRTPAFSLRCFCSQLTCPMSAWERRSTMARSGPALPPRTAWTAEGEADPAGSRISERALSRAVALCCLGGTLPPPPCRSPSVSSDPRTAPHPPPVAGCAGESPAVTEGGVYATLPLHRCLSSGLLAPWRSLATSQLFPFPVLIPRLRNATLKCFL
uniref:uncharacterized protein LOC118550424 isoform X2 n=1 Tax=Halichoerus grypus TaxID=9711 RepID=UPI00165A0037|nr:uncharacterized protein LOC118550424 isoform X2 [Halichoerus grypus]